MSAHMLHRPALRAVPHAAVGLRRRTASAGPFAWFFAMLRAIETRRYLTEMDDRMLKDIGVSRSEARREADRAPWDLQPHSPWEMR